MNFLGNVKPYTVDYFNKMDYYIKLLKQFLLSRKYVVKEIHRNQSYDDSDDGYFGEMRLFEKPVKIGEIYVYGIDFDGEMYIAHSSYEMEIPYNILHESDFDNWNTAGGFIEYLIETGNFKYFLNMIVNVRI